MISLAELSREIDHLDPIPVSQPRLAQVVADPTADLQQIVTIIEYDPALTSNTLRMANSAYFSPGTRVHSVKEAVQRLGAGRILQHAVGHGIRGRLIAACPGYDLVEHELWRHSVAAALAAEQLSLYAKTRIHPVAFTAALLHDIGKFLLSRHLTDDLKAEITELEQNGRLPYVEAERTILGFDHAQVGGVIARRWNFPDVLVEAIAHHHHPHHPHLGDGDHTALDAVHIGNTVAKIIGIGIGSEEMNMLADSRAARGLGLTPTTLEALCAAVAIELPAVVALFEEEEHGVQHSDR
ncbi:HDOD domain-containing protein [bacterium]|nr:HDOD domain-containing protein [bacterium]MBU1984356.1 HDOD domain-containing protein [bacterium]